MIQRRKDYVKREPSRDAHKIYLVCEGKGTEPDYFRFFEGLSSNLQVITIPPADGSDPIKLMELAKKDLIGPGRKYTVECEHGDTVWFIIDTDTWEEEGKIKLLRDFCLVQNSSIKDQMDEVKTRIRYGMWLKVILVLRFGYTIISMIRSRLKRKSGIVPPLRNLFIRRFPEGLILRRLRRG